MTTKAPTRRCLLDVVESYRGCDEAASAIYDDGRTAEKMTEKIMYITFTE